ncbi:6-phosphogluconolactonase [Arcticibacter svalbardensis MN12-7]|uniref:6-phosphogluconolactonase n=1 Tax=Arcticibacter svalbardensis MN12-7 TaxID=1150600 RepID=R9GLN3_9SPHI|nr:lactonase family protein [Arcticibacter svalbardensis]EOR92618.1 6-phosphogluconolactonase [Arcticibacter svalbardensis MN12-7]
MRNTFLLIIMSLIALHQASAQNLNLIVGTYTNKGNSEGIYVYNFDSTTGKLSPKNKATGVSNPSYLTPSNNGKFVYSTNEDNDGSISSFAFDKLSGKLKFLNKKTAQGGGTCYIAVDATNKYVFAGNYGQGNLVVYSVLPDGSLGNLLQSIQDTGSGVNKSRQEGPHVHSTILSPDQKFLLVSDLGTDKISVYSFDNNSSSEPLKAAEPPYVTVEPGDGPRHLDFHPNSKYVYALMEMTGNVLAFSNDQGKMEKIQTISMVAKGFTGQTGAADIHVSPDGKFLYSSNRGDANDIAIFSINPSTGMLTLKGHQSTLGKGPRNFVIDPKGNFLLVANNNSNEIIVFKRNKVTGLLKATGEKVALDAPVCLKFSK